MAQSCVIPGVDQILDTMICLTRPMPLQRVIAAGSNGMALYLGLRRRGFIRTTMPALCHDKRARHGIGLIAGRIESCDSSVDTERDLERISAFLSVNAGLALLVGSGQNGVNIRRKLEQLGFRVEAGVRCSHGLVLSASRQGYQQMASAA